jgi:hypothetical protein
MKWTSSVDLLPDLSNFFPGDGIAVARLLRGEEFSSVGAKNPRV